MPAHITNLVGIVLFLAIGSIFVLVSYALVWALAPTDKSVVKGTPYECGEIVVGQPWIHIHIRYYVLAILFLIFDIETVFLFPWAVLFKKLGLFGLIEMVIFIVILLIGLVYPWKKGVLQWDRSF